MNDPRRLQARGFKGQRIQFQLDGKKKTGKVVEADWWLVVRVEGEDVVVYVDPAKAKSAG